MVCQGRYDNPYGGGRYTESSEKNNGLRLYVAPGTGTSVYEHYEDDGESRAYEVEYAFTKITKKSTSASCTVKVAAREELTAGCLRTGNSLCFSEDFPESRHQSE